MNRRICVVTGSRAEFGLLRRLMHEINNHPKLVLEVIVTGMHLSPEFGSTYREIEAEGIKISVRVEMLLSADTDTSIVKSIGVGLMGFADAYERLQPDLVVLLGDRFEIFAAASAAMIFGIPIAHLHGGETTEGSFDEAIRHSITKMAHLHFVATEEYQNRVIQLGEQPDRVFNVGPMCVDAINSTKLMSREELELSLDISFGEKSLLITFHPTTIEGSTNSIAQTRELISALSDLEDTTLLLNTPNADSGGREMEILLRQFAEQHPRAKVFRSLGQLRFFSCLAQVDGVVGNSSSGLIEAPFFKIGTVNIGDRQKGRLKSAGVIDCAPHCEAILEAIKVLYSPDFQATLAITQNTNGIGGNINRVVEVISEFPLTNICKKEFYNLSVSDVSRGGGKS